MPDGLRLTFKVDKMHARAAEIQRKLLHESRLSPETRVLLLELLQLIQEIEMGAFATAYANIQASTATQIASLNTEITALQAKVAGTVPATAQQIAAGNVLTDSADITAAQGIVAAGTPAPAPAPTPAPVAAAPTV